MGFMTEISILNDRWDSVAEMIRKRPEDFINEVNVLMNGRPQYGPADENGRSEYLGSLVADDIRGTQCTVYTSHHADDPRLYFAWRNSFISLSKYDLEQEFGVRFDNEKDSLLDTIEKEVLEAERILKSTKQWLKAKREAREAAPVNV